MFAQEIAVAKEEAVPRIRENIVYNEIVYNEIVYNEIVYNECAVRGLKSDQDFAFCGRMPAEDSETNEAYDWFYGGDGHGRNALVDLLRSLDPHTVIAKRDSLRYIQDQIEPQKAYHQSSGSTYYEARVFGDRVEVTLSGDSQIAIMIDGKIEYISTPHNMRNPLEQERLAHRMQMHDVWVTASGNVGKILASDKMTLRESEYVHFANGDKIAMSQSLGHQNITGLMPEKFTLSLQPGQVVCVVGGSDGLWDMINLAGESAESDIAFLASHSAAEIVDWIEARWKQEWTIFWKDPKSQRDCVAKQRFMRSEYDDVSACVIRKTV
jgi:serine/threonine protein phosphatase PrpC